jgi:hypothetical protein
MRCTLSTVLLLTLLCPMIWGAPAVAYTEDGLVPPGAPTLTVEVIKDPGEARLAAAIREHQLGHRDIARGMLAELLLDTDGATSEVGREALIYMGELHYIEGDEETARRFFEQVASADPGHLIDPFRHPPDVCGFYNYVRAYVVPAIEVVGPIEAPPPVPWTAWLPIGGVYQLTHGQTGKGAAFLVGELALLTGSSTLFAVYASNRHVSSSDPEALARAQALRTAQWLVTAGYWGVWTWSRVDANRHWQDNWRVSPDVALGPARQLGMVFQRSF